MRWRALTTSPGAPPHKLILTIGNSRFDSSNVLGINWLSNAPQVLTPVSAWRKDEILAPATVEKFGFAPEADMGDFHKELKVA
jgi:hypothetical protein